MPKEPEIKINKKEALTCLEFLGYTASLLEELLVVRLAVQDTIHGGIATYL
jgi:hypothetical protein